MNYPDLHCSALLLNCGKSTGFDLQCSETQIEYYNYMFNNLLVSKYPTIYWTFSEGVKLICWTDQRGSQWQRSCRRPGRCCWRPGRPGAGSNWGSKPSGGPCSTADGGWQCHSDTQWFNRHCVLENTVDAGECEVCEVKYDAGECEVCAVKYDAGECEVCAVKYDASECEVFAVIYDAVSVKCLQVTVRVAQKWRLNNTLWLR